MSSIFWDQLTALDEVEEKIKALEVSSEEREEIWMIVDEIIHHKVMGCILDHLPGQHHQDFLNRFHQKPHDTELFDYLREKAGEDIEAVLKSQMDQIKQEILADLT
jgi:hypothetical protein